jgi:polysaccharide export outer membrane protein
MSKKYQTLKLLVWVIISTTVLQACAKRENFIYFQGPISTDTLDLSSNKYLPVIKVDDLIDIKVSSSNIEASTPFNLSNQYTTYNGSYTSGNPSPQSYLVNEDGNINFPVLGEVKIAGLSRNQVVENLQFLLIKYLDNPIVNIRITNFKVTVLGDVARPGSFTIPNERITIPEALGIAGDLNVSGKRTNIKLIRERDGAKEIHVLDLTNSKLLSSPLYYLEQNDILYIEQNRTKMNSSLYSPIYSLVLSATALIITTINVLIR